MSAPWLPACLVLAGLSLIVIAPLAGLLGIAGWPGYDSADLAFWHSPYIRRVLGFSLWQAGLSAVLAVGPAILVARAFYRQADFPLRGLLLRLFALPLVVPAVVAVMGVVAVYGASGWIPLGRSLYGLNGILLAHVFFNLPLAVRLLLPHWYAIPAHHWQLAEQLDFDGWQRWRLIEWPALREGLPGVLLLVFMLCLTSFAVVLTLGGGPRSTTLEVAIYQSLRFDFNPVRAVLLAALQLSLCLAVAWATMRMQRLPEVEIAIDSFAARRPGARRPGQLALIATASLFVAMPLLALLIDGLVGPLARVLGNPATGLAVLHTLAIGLASTTLALLAGWYLLRLSAALAAAGRQRGARLLELSGSIVYVVPPLVIGTGLFVLLSPWVDVFDWVFPIVVLVNAVMALPFVVRTLGPALRRHQARYGPLCEQLALTGWARFRHVDWPLLRGPLGLSAALAMALSMGDLGVIALFGTPDTATLPLLIYQQLGAYRGAEAAVSALLLLVLCLGAFAALERGIGGPKDA